jgi:hypothetical protein
VLTRDGLVHKILSKVALLGIGEPWLWWKHAFLMTAARGGGVYSYYSATGTHPTRRTTMQVLL